ncbi:phosphate ABC transporter ATP-binding protein [Pontibacillus yanchengensis]|nr:phosphate ABC transporter ATP-binding protein [Pontibacillus yanchengensis]
MSTQTMYSFQNVSKGPLQNINLSIETGEKVIIFGPSGAGKSTLLHLFNRLQDPDSGEILFNGKSLSSYHIPNLRTQAGLVMQAPHLFPGTVLENIKYGPSLRGKWREKEAEELLSYVQLPAEYKNRDVNHLSGGEQQRVSLARTLANKPDVLLLDEPTSALDQHTIEEIEEVLECLIQENQLTMIMVTHNLRQAKRLGDKGLFLSEGEILESGPISTMLQNPTTESLQSFLA